MRRHAVDGIDAPAPAEEAEQPPELRAFRPRSVVRTVCAAVALFALGSVMLFFGVQALRTERDRGIAMCTVGALAFLPGSYATWHLYGAWRQWAGYSYDMIPSYDE